MPELRDATTSNEGQTRSTSQERPKTADDKRSRSFSRPRTATRAADHSADLQMLGQTIEIRAGDETFSFPTPSPRLPPKSATFHHKPSPLNASGSPAIGVALGSPSQAAMPCWGRSITADHISSRMPVLPPPARAPPAIPDQSENDGQRTELRRKKSTWKKFGDLFGRKAPRPLPEEPFYKLKPTREQDRVTDKLHPPPAATGFASPGHSPFLKRSQSSSPAPHQRTPSMTRSRARLEARAEAELASFNRESKPKKWRSPSMIQKEGFSPMFRALNYPRDSEDMFRSIDQERTDSPLSMNEKAASCATPSTPRLALDLPDSKFERYSVMFEKLLEEPKPSLLERRQSKMQRRKSLKTLDPVSSVGEEGSDSPQAANGVPQRSLTSPFLKKSLSISVGKKANNAATATAANGTAVNRPRPIQRSKTAPTAAASPIAQTFAKAKIAMGLGRSPQSPRRAEEEVPATPMTFATLSDGDSPAAVHDDQNRNADQAEPRWDMLTSKPARLGTEERPDAYLRVKSPQDLERQIVQVSVARQVSVSKARQQVQQAVASKQPLRPRIVELSKDRKSTVVLIETEEEWKESATGG